MDLKHHSIAFLSKNAVICLHGKPCFSCKSSAQAKYVNLTSFRFKSWLKIAILNLSFLWSLYPNEKAKVKYGVVRVTIYQ